MLKKIPTLLLLLLLSAAYSHAQSSVYPVFLIEPEMMADANAIVRFSELEINIADVDKQIVKTTRIITVLNKKGNSALSAYEFYDDNSAIKKQEAVIYDFAGNKVAKYRKKDFTDQSHIGAGTIFSDNRVSFLSYTPKEYPYTMVYTSEVHDNSTVFLNPWYPVNSYYLSVEKSIFKIKNPKKLPLRIGEFNLDEFDVQKVGTDLEPVYNLKDFKGYRHEILSPEFIQFAPVVKIVPEQFSLMGVKGIATNWTEFGKWQYDVLLQNKVELPQQTLDKVTHLVADAKTDSEKAKRIYEFVQGKTRYVSVQLGIGGWEPMPALEVDKLGYGDCKGLTNYTRALLASQGISSNYAVVYAGKNKRELDPDFASMQGNHVILNVPTETEDIWLECTSQTIPFNYLGDFTDGRNVLLVKPEGGQIVKTPSFLTEENLIASKSIINLRDDLGFTAEMEMRSEGVHYGNEYPLERKKEEDQVVHFKNHFGNLKSLDIQNLQFTNDRDNKKFVTNMTVQADKFISKAGAHYLVPLTLFPIETYNLPRTEKRRFPIQILRGEVNKDTFEYIVPEGFAIDFMPEDIKIENQFGALEIKTSVKEEDGQKRISVLRNFTVNEGLWDPENFEEFRQFNFEVNTSNNLKAIIVAQ